MANMGSLGWWLVVRKRRKFGPPLMTLASYTVDHPNATIVNGDGGIGGVRIIAGGGAGAWDNFTGFVDAFKINGSIFNFEPCTPPQLTVTANGGTLTSNNNGVSDGAENATFSVCDQSNNITFSGFQDQASAQPPTAVKVRQEFTLSNLTWCCTDGNYPLSAFQSPATFSRDARLINPNSPGTLVMRFRSFYDGNGNNTIDPGEALGDWLTWTVTVTPAPTWYQDKDGDGFVGAKTQLYTTFRQWLVNDRKNCE